MKLYLSVGTVIRYHNVSIYSSVYLVIIELFPFLQLEFQTNALSKRNIVLLLQWKEKLSLLQRVRSITATAVFATRNRGTLLYHKVARKLGLLKMPNHIMRVDQMNKPSKESIKSRFPSLLSGFCQLRGNSFKSYNFKQLSTV